MHQDYFLYDAMGNLSSVSIAVHDDGGRSGYKQTHRYDINGQLAEALDSQGHTSYFTVAGKTIGDLCIDKQGFIHLDVYGGFTPTGSLEQVVVVPAGWGVDWGKGRGGHWEKRREFEIKVIDGSLPDAPQDNFGAYTLQAGNTLESIALQVYGDASLWYLIADANGLTARNSHAGEKGGQMHVGLRLNIPLVLGVNQD